MLKRSVLLSVVSMIFFVSCGETVYQESALLHTEAVIIGVLNVADPTGEKAMGISNLLGSISGGMPELETTTKPAIVFRFSEGDVYVTNRDVLSIFQDMIGCKVKLEYTAGYTVHYNKHGQFVWKKFLFYRYVNATLIW